MPRTLAPCAELTLFRRILAVMRSDVDKISSDCEYDAVGIGFLRAVIGADPEIGSFFSWW